MSVVFQYIEGLLRRQQSIGVFAEGHRSNSGKPLYPNAGVLSGVVSAYYEGRYNGQFSFTHQSIFCDSNNSMLTVLSHIKTFFTTFDHSKKIKIFHSNNIIAVFRSSRNSSKCSDNYILNIYISVSCILKYKNVVLYWTSQLRILPAMLCTCNMILFLLLNKFLVLTA